MKKLLKYLADLRWWRPNIEGSKIDFTPEELQALRNIAGSEG